jgi:hypothetical protein
MEDRRIKVYDGSGRYLGYARLGKDDTGEQVAEIYNTDADRLGALRLRPMEYATMEALVFNQDGDQIGYVLMENSQEPPLNGEVFWMNSSGEDQTHLAHVHLSTTSGEASVFNEPPWGDQIGRLEPQNVSEEELVVVGGGAALLLLF